MGVTPTLYIQMLKLLVYRHMIKEISKRAVLLYPLFFFVSFLTLYIFYNLFGISINVWIGIPELILLFVDDVVDFIRYAFFLMLSTGLMFWVQDIKTSFSGKQRFWFNFIRVTSIIAAAGIMVYLSFATEREFWAKIFNVCLYLAIAIPIGYILHMRHIDAKWRDRYSRLDILTIVLVAAFILNAFLKPVKKAVMYHNAGYSKILLKDSTVIDSVVYLGKTEKYYMFYSRKKSAARVIKEESVKKVLLANGFEVYY